MAERVRTPREKVLHSYASQMLEIETNKIDALRKTIRKKSSWLVFILSSLFTIGIYGVLLLSRVEGNTLFSTALNEIIVSIGFNFLFTLGFSLALMHTLIFPQRLNLYLEEFTESKDKDSNKSFFLSAIVGLILSILMSTSLYQLWVIGDWASPIVDIVILIGIFIHMMRGLNFWHIGNQLHKIQLTYIKDLRKIMEEFEEKRKELSDGNSW